jgi:ubiquinone/menaquinone biosynthesis C-methylase UbiE
MSKSKEILKILLYRANLLNLFSKLRYKTYNLLKEGYNPKIFWNGWSDNYSRQKAQQRIDNSHYWLLEKVEALKPKNILEIGCGFGRNLTFLLENLSYPVGLVGFDISASMIRKAKKSLDDKVLLGCADINFLPFCEKSYDLVFAYATLMHVPEQNIKNAICEIERVAKKYVVIIEETYWSIGNIGGVTLKPNEYTFIYDYTKLLSECGLVIEEAKEQKGDWNLIYLVCSKKESQNQ